MTNDKFSMTNSQFRLTPLLGALSLCVFAPSRLCVKMFFLAALMALAPRARAGDSGLNVIVVVNQNSSNSVQLGNDYCQQRGVPPQNLFRMTNWTGGAINWQQSDFENCLLNPLLAMVSSRGLTNQAEIVLLSMDIPYRVLNGDSQNSTTSALFYGFKTNTAPSAQPARHLFPAR